MKPINLTQLTLPTVMLQVVSITTHALCEEDRQYFISYNGEFVVSRHRVRSQPVALYQLLHSYLLVRTCGVHSTQKHRLIAPVQNPDPLDSDQN